MKTRLAFTLLLILCSVPSAYAQLPVNILEGTWRMTARTEIYADTTIVRDDVPPSIKMLNSTHFAWGYQSDDGQEILAGGGTYTLEGDSLYTEYIEYHVTPPLVGMAIKFKARVEGDTWYHTGQLGDFKLLEVWQRVR